MGKYGWWNFGMWQKLRRALINYLWHINFANLYFIFQSVTIWILMVIFTPDLDYSLSSCNLIIAIIHAVLRFSNKFFWFVLFLSLLFFFFIAQLNLLIMRNYLQDNLPDLLPMAHEYESKLFNTTGVMRKFTIDYWGKLSNK